MMPWGREGNAFKDEEGAAEPQVGSVVDLEQKHRGHKDREVTHTQTWQPVKWQQQAPQGRAASDSAGRRRTLDSWIR